MKKISILPKFYLMMACFIPMTFLIGCTRDVKNSGIEIQLPKVAYQASKLSGQKVTAFSKSDPWNGNSINSSSNINCYVVAVGGPLAKHKVNKCKDRATDSVAMEFSAYVGGVAAGSSIKLDVEAGSGRVIYLMGMEADAGACVSFKGDGPPDGKLSYPRLVAQKTINLSPGNQSVSLTVPSDISGLPEIGDCQVDDQDNGEGTGDGPSAVNLFGDGRDGDVVFDSTGALPDAFNIIGSIDYSASGVSKTGSDASITSTKVISANNAIVGLGTGNKKLLTLKDSFTTDQFDVNDEVFWHVSAANDTTNGPDQGCYGNAPENSDIFRGSFGFANIVEVNIGTKEIELDSYIGNTESISSGDAASLNLRLAETSRFTHVDHCKIQIVRVPNFDSLTIQGDAPLTFRTALGYNHTSKLGGLMVFRAKTIILNENLSLSTAGRGYGTPSNKAGNSSIGEQGTGSGNNNGESGGKSSTSLQGAGGANAGSGGNGSAGVTGGTPMTLCSGHCLPATEHKIFFGGAGGASGTNYAGTSGGGIIIVYAETIDTSAAKTLEIESNAAAGATDAGGGAGGSIMLWAKNLMIPSLALRANGGSPSTGGGGGGAGLIQVKFCESESSLSLSSLQSDSQVIGGTATNSGGSGYEDISDDPGACIGF